MCRLRMVNQLTSLRTNQFPGIKGLRGSTSEVPITWVMGACMESGQ
jgi:hypothetical protein